LEWLLVIVGIVVCLGVAAVIGSQQSPLWPVPGLYLIEFILITIVGAANQLATTGLLPFRNQFLG
jgi:energy-converting hydrogenase Eha subunit C